MASTVEPSHPAPDGLDLPKSARSDDDDAVVDLTIVGAGVVGIATAYAAARRGLSVRIVDRASGPAMGASFANGAQLSYAYTESMASPSLWTKLPSIALGMDQALSMRWSLDPDFLRWGIAFLANATPEKFRANTLAVLDLAAQSRAAMDDLLQRHRIDFEHTTPGKMHLFRDAAALDAAAAMVAIKQKHGVEQSILSPQQAIDIEPALAGASGLVGVVHSPAEEAGDPQRFCVGLLALLVADYGVTACFDFDVAKLATTPEGVCLEARDGRRLRSRKLVSCAGVDAVALARDMGTRLPLLPVKGYSFTAAPGNLAPRVSITDIDRKLVFCRLGDKLRVAGLAEVGNRNAAVDPRRAEHLVAMARDSLPAAAAYDAIDSTWAGLRPMTPSSVPIIQRIQPNVVVNVGHGMLGWTLAMGAGERALQALLEK
ncbi:FAD-dependent oxidoreductase [Lysobacter sp. A286]